MSLKKIGGRPRKKSLGFMVVLRRKKVSENKYHLYLDINYKGYRKKEYLRLYLTGSKYDKDILRLAEELRVKTEYDIMTGGYVTSKNMNNSFYDFFDKYLNTFQRQSEKKNLVKHLKAFKSDLTFADINAKFWAGFKGYLTQLDHAPYTIYNEFCTLKSLVNAALKLELIPKNGLLNVKEKKPATHREYLVLDELKLLEKTPCRKPEVKNAFMFACYTGLRYGDLKSLTYANINNNQIELRQQKTQDFVYIPISEHSLKYISFEGKKPDDKVFGRLAKGTVHAVLREWITAAGITKKIIFHSSRHTFATLGLTYGIPIEVVSSLLGHTDIRTTQIYAKIISQKKQEAVKKLPEF